MMMADYGANLLEFLAGLQAASYERDMQVFQPSTSSHPDSLLEEPHLLPENTGAADKSRITVHIYLKTCGVFAAPGTIWTTRLVMVSVVRAAYL